MIKYEVIIYWSDEDKVYLAEVPEFPGCTACLINNHPHPPCAVKV